MPDSELQRENADVSSPLFVPHFQYTVRAVCAVGVGYGDAAAVPAGVVVGGADERLMHSFPWPGQPLPNLLPNWGGDLQIFIKG